MVRDVFGRDATFARSIVNELAARYRSVVTILKNQKLRTGIEWLANWLWMKIIVKVVMAVS